MRCDRARRARSGRARRPAAARTSPRRGCRAACAGSRRAPTPGRRPSATRSGCSSPRRVEQPGEPAADTGEHDVVDRAAERCRIVLHVVERDAHEPEAPAAPDDGALSDVRGATTPLLDERRRASARARAARPAASRGAAALRARSRRELDGRADDARAACRCSRRAGSGGGSGVHGGDSTTVRLGGRSRAARSRRRRPRRRRSARGAIFWMSATCPPSSPSTNHSSQSGRVAVEHLRLHPLGERRRAGRGCPAAAAR